MEYEHQKVLAWNLQLQATWTFYFILFWFFELIEDNSPIDHWDKHGRPEDLHQGFKLAQIQTFLKGGQVL